MKTNHHSGSAWSLSFIVLGFFLITSDHLSAEDNLIQCPGFEEEKTSATKSRYPLGNHWREISKPSKLQTLSAVAGHDSEVALELSKTEGQGTYHRIVNDLTGVTLKAQTAYRLQFDYWVGDDIPKRQLGISVGVSSNGGSHQSTIGTNFWLPDAFICLDEASIEEANKWVTVTVRFTADKNYENPCILIAEDWWCEPPYTFRFDNFRLTESK